MNTQKPLYVILATLVQQRDNCIESNNEEWLNKSETRIKQLVQDYMPSGSGVDSGTDLDLNKSRPDKLVFYTHYHHMNEHGFYDGWTDHTMTVLPSLSFGYTLKISGPNRNDIKEYLDQVFSSSLEELVDQYEKQEAQS